MEVRLLERIENSSLDKKRIFFGWDKREEEATYNINYIPLGRESTSGKKVYLDMSGYGNILVLGNTGSGKTFLTKGMICRFLKSGWKIAILSDIKSEYGSMMFSGEERFADYLMSGEILEGLPIKSYYPYFLSKYLNYKPKNDILFQLPLSDISYTDLLTILGMEEEHKDKKAVIEMLAGRIKEKRLTTFNEIIEFLSTQDVYVRTQKSLINIFKTLQYYGVFGNQYTADFVEDMNKGYIPILSLKGFDQLGAESGWTSAYVSILARKIRQAKEQGRLKGKVLLIFEEVPRFAPREGNPSSKKTIEKLAREGRGLGISNLFISQDLYEVTDILFSQSKYIFLPYNIDVDELKVVFRRKGVDYEWSPSFTNSLFDTIRTMSMNRKTGEREWMFIDQEEKDYQIFYPYAPFCKVV
ncbi:MAG: DUF87 domain-containing protein [Candidatus Aenigmatarchaeota archaeon]